MQLMLVWSAARRCLVTIALGAFTAHAVLGQSYVDFSTLPAGVGGVSWRPSQLAMGPDGSLYVATESDKLVAFDPSGKFSHSFDLPPFYGEMNGLAIDSTGALHAAWTNRLVGFDQNGLQTYNYSHFSNINDVAVDANDRLFVSRSSGLGVLESDATLTPVPTESTSYWRNISFGQNGALYALVDRAASFPFGPAVQVYEDAGVLTNEFQLADDVNHGGFTNLTGMATSGDSIYIATRNSGAVQKYSLTGELLGLGYGTPRSSDLLVTSSGNLLSAAPHASIVESVGQERFDPGYSGVTRMLDRPRISYSFGEEQQPETQVDLTQGWTETTAPSFFVPGAPGEMVELTFRRVQANNAVVSVFPVDHVLADPLDQPMEYMRQAFDSSLTHVIASQAHPCFSNPFCGDEVDATALATITVEAGTEIGFLFQSMQWRSPSQFVSWSTNPALNDLSQTLAATAFAELATMSEEDLAEYRTQGFEFPDGPLVLLPLASDSRANWGRMDQFVFFLSEDSTFLAMEDLHIAGSSDLSFHDATLLIDTRLIPAPEPGSCLVVILSSICSVFCRGRLS